MFVVTCLFVSLFVCPAFAVTYRTAPMKKYLSEKACWGTYGTTLGNYFKIREKDVCGVKCTEMSGCNSFLYNINAGWCSLNSDAFLNKTASGCQSLVDYAEITTINTVRHAPPPTHCGPVPYMSSIVVNTSSGNYSIGSQFPYRCRPCTSFPPDTSPGVVTCGADGRWIIPSELCVYGPDVGLLRDGSAIPVGAVGCGVTFNDTCPQNSVSTGLRFNGVTGRCYCDGACCSAGDCCFDSTCEPSSKDYDIYYDDYYYYY